MHQGVAKEGEMEAREPSGRNRFTGIFYLNRGKMQGWGRRRRRRRRRRTSIDPDENAAGAVRTGKAFSRVSARTEKANQFRWNTPLIRITRAICQIETDSFSLLTRQMVLFFSFIFFFFLCPIVPMKCHGDGKYA